MNSLDDWASQETGEYPKWVGGTGGEKVVPGDERDVFNREQADAKANARLRADFGAEAAE